MSQSQQGECAEDVVHLYVWGGEWGLPSVDIESLQALAITRFSGAPAQVVPVSNPWKTPSHKIPYFRHGDSVFHTARDLGTYLKSKNFNCDSALDATESSEVLTYAFRLIEDLLPALNYFCWMNEENFNKVIRPFYGYRLPWFYKMWYPERMRDRATAVLKTIYPDVSPQELKSVEASVLERARACLMNLNEKLGSKEFFLPGSTPTTLDAVAFSFLAPFLKIPLPHNPLKQDIQILGNLESFVNRISQRYLSSGPQGDGGQPSTSYFSSWLHGSPSGDSSQEPKESIVDKPAVRGFFWAMLVAAGMIFYARKLGYIHHRPSIYIDEDDEDDVIEYDEY